MHADLSQHGVTSALLFAVIYYIFNFFVDLVLVCKPDQAHRIFACTKAARLVAAKKEAAGGRRSTRTAGAPDFSPDAAGGPDISMMMNPLQQSSVAGGSSGASGDKSSNAPTLTAADLEAIDGTPSAVQVS
jgi:hypothetical protein